MLSEYSKCKEGPSDPPHIAANVHQTKWYRIAPLANLGFSPTPQTIAGLTLPNHAIGWSGFRIRKLRIWAPDSTVASVSESYAVTLSLPGIVATGAATSFAIGDGATYQDSGVVGQRRACVEVTPSAEFRNKWWQASDALSVPFAASTAPLAAATSNELFLVDLLLDTMSNT